MVRVKLELLFLVCHQFDRTENGKKEKIKSGYNRINYQKEKIWLSLFAERTKSSSDESFIGFLLVLSILLEKRGCKYSKSPLSGIVTLIFSTFSFPAEVQ